MGLRPTAYERHSIEDIFINVMAAFGSLVTGYDSEASLGEVTEFLRYEASPRWPVLLYGTFAHSFTGLVA